MEELFKPAGRADGDSHLQLGTQTFAALSLKLIDCAGTNAFARVLLHYSTDSSGYDSLLNFSQPS